MARILTDDEIEALLREPKRLPADWQSILQPRRRVRFLHKEKSIDLRGEWGNNFILYVRSSSLNPLDFSVILVILDKDGTEYRLLRANGKHASRHTNLWEKGRGLSPSRLPVGFHVHKATQRYQEEGFRIDGYAETCQEYETLEQAVHYVVKEANAVLPAGSQLPLM
jgi:hypothetical protein